MEMIEVVRATMVVSAVCYALIAIVMFPIQNGAAWTALKALVIVHGLSTAGAILTTFQMQTVPPGIGIWVNTLGRLAGAMLNVALALLLYREGRSQNRQGGAS